MTLLLTTVQSGLKPPEPFKLKVSFTYFSNSKARGNGCVRTQGCIVCVLMAQSCVEELELCFHLRILI